MIIGQIKDGIVLDHITAGNGARLYELLGLDALTCTVAFIRNVPSKKMGRKDIIKVDGDVTLNLDVIGYVDPAATVNIIRDGELVEKKNIAMPLQLTNVIKCKNPRCITSVEREIVHEFKLTDPVKKVYRCIYCEQKA